MMLDCNIFECYNLIYSTLVEIENALKVFHRTIKILLKVPFDIVRTRISFKETLEIRDRFCFDFLHAIPKSFG